MSAAPERISALGELRESLREAARGDVAAAGWGVKVFSSRNGRRCVVAGVVNGVTLGRLSGGRFHRYPADLAGTCARPGRPFGAVQRMADRTLVFGLARPGAPRVTITLSGRHHLARTGRGGAVLAVYRGEVTGDQLKIDYES